MGDELETPTLNICFWAHLSTALLSKFFPLPLHQLLCTMSMDNLCKNASWKHTDVQDDENVVGCKYVFTLKGDTNFNIKRFKTSLVVQQYSPEIGIVTV